MRYKRVIKDYNKNYAARIRRYPSQIKEMEQSFHWHEDYELVCVIEGTLRLLKFDEEITLHDGDVYFINSEEIHAYGRLDDLKQLLMINFPPAAIQSYAETPETFMKFEVKSEESKNAIRHIMSRLYNAKGDDSVPYILYTKASLNYLMYHLFTDCRNDSIKYILGSDSDDFDCAKSAIIYMRRNFREDISLNEIAGIVGMTPAHFSKYFKDKTECTFSRYLRKIRLECAVQEMLSGKTANAASEASGFPNVNSFILACKAEYGKTPMELKNSMLI